MFLDEYKDKMGLKIIERPPGIRPPKKNFQLWPNGTLSSLGDTLINIIKEGYALEMNYESLTNSNLTTLHTYMYKRGYKLHCWRAEHKRVLFVEKKT